MRAQQLSRVGVDLEEPEPVKVYVNDTVAVAYVRGRETWDLVPGKAKRSARSSCGSIYVTPPPAG
jgi:hypothetical protein